MPAATVGKSSNSVNALSSIAPTNTSTAVQSGPYTKAQFQTTLEGSRTIKSSKEVEQLLRDYPAALELYQTGKYKVKVKCEAEVERVILVEKRSSKRPALTESDENSQTVPELSINNSEQNKVVSKEQDSRQSRSRTHSRDRIAPQTSETNATSGDNMVHATISSIRMTSNTQPKVEHHRTPSREREPSVTTSQKQHAHHRSQSRDSQHKGVTTKQQGKQINREYPKQMAPFPPNTWQQQQQQQQFPRPYFSNPLLQQQQQQQQQQQRANVYMPATFAPQQTPLYRQPFYYGQRTSVPVAYPQQQPAYPTLSSGTVGQLQLHSTNNYPSASRSTFNNLAPPPPSFRTFHFNQQKQQVPSVPAMYQSQAPFPLNPPWANMANKPVGAFAGSNATFVDPNKGARNRARSVDAGPRAIQPVRPAVLQQQPAVGTEHYYHYHHRHHHHRPRPQPTNNVGPPVENGNDANVPSKESTNVAVTEKLTVRQLNDTFTRADPSGRLAYTVLPGVLQRFGITLTENDLSSAAKELEYDVNEPISARRLVHVLVKLGKITKSGQQQQRPAASPSVPVEDREVTDIMTQRQTVTAQTHTTNQRQ